MLCVVVAVIAVIWIVQVAAISNLESAALRTEGRPAVGTKRIRITGSGDSVCLYADSRLG